MEKVNYFDEYSKTREQFIEGFKMSILYGGKKWEQVKIQDVWYSKYDKQWKLTGYYGKA